MQCPIDGETLLMTSREGVEIDYCPRCRGVWLDRGELDKIIERSDTAGSNPSKAQIETRSRKRDDDDDHDDDDDRRGRKRRDKRESKPDYYRKSKKHVSFIKELFDF